MQRALAVVFILSYVFAGIAVPLGSALYIQHKTAPIFPFVCPCGCEGDEQKCTCHHRTATTTFNPCGMGTNNFIVPDAGISMAIVIVSYAGIPDPFQPSFLFSITDVHTLPGVVIRVEHPPRLFC